MKKIYFLLCMAFYCSSTINAQVTASWTPLTSGTTTSLLDVSAPTANICYVSGNLGIILKTTNGGTTWSTQTTGTTQHLYSIFFTDLNNGYAVGNAGTAIRTTNGGTTWTAMTMGSPADFRHIYFTDANTGYVTGGPAGSPGIILKTTNGGTSWTSLSTTSLSTNTIYCLHFTSATDGYAVDYDGNILKTTNAGTSWSSLVSGTTAHLYCVYFPSINKGVVTSITGDIRITSNAGTSWSGITSGTTDSFNGLDFYDANNGFTVGGNVGTNVGRILSTTDGGTTWSSYSPGTTRLYGVDMFNSNTGYAVGLNGTILKYTSNVGIDEKSAGMLTFSNYPNPFSSSSTIDFGAYHFENAATVELYDISGKMVKSIVSEKESKVTLERNNLSAGTYIYKVLDGSKYIGSGKMTIE